jgi:peptidoglycan-associated lipoprotein
VQEVEAVKTETVSAEDATVGESGMLSLDFNEMIMVNLERELSTVYFDYDKFNIRADMQDKVTNSATVANAGASAFTVKLEGNCDEWGSDEYNFALGLKRASTVKKALMAEGVNETRITMVSYGESNPVCNDKTQDCWSKNRRVDFKLLP